MLAEIFTTASCYVKSFVPMHLIQSPTNSVEKFPLISEILEPSSTVTNTTLVHRGKPSCLFACWYFCHYHVFLFQARSKMEWAKTNLLDFLFCQSFHLSQWYLSVSTFNIFRPMFNWFDFKCPLPFLVPIRKCSICFEKLAHLLTSGLNKSTLQVLATCMKEVPIIAFLMLL